MGENKPDLAKMRPGCVSACIDHLTYMYGQTDGRTDWWNDSKNMLVDHLFQCRISLWPKTAEKRGFRTGVTDRRADRPTDRRTDRPSYRDAFLTDASKKRKREGGDCNLALLSVSLIISLSLSLSLPM